MLAFLKALAAVFAASVCQFALAQAADYLKRMPEDEIIYFVLPDRFENGDPKNDKGGLKGDRYKTGFDPSHKGFYHGGDLKGLTQRLDYIQGMGITAIWFAPIFKNKPVQGGPGNESAGYHGYWATDFTSVDPHFGSNGEFCTFVDAAHKRGMKVYMDIITNHTADVIYFAECEDMFASKVSIYNDNDLVGTDSTNAAAKFNTAHPLYAQIAQLAKLRSLHPALRRGRQVVRHYDDKPGLFAISRFDPDNGREFILLFNTSSAAISSNVQIDIASGAIENIRGECTAKVTAPASLQITLPPLGYAICAATSKIEK